MTAARPLPLAGIRVVDFGHILAGPFCVRMLADLGADVVKIETSTRLGRTGARRGGKGNGTAHGRTPLLGHINRNRRSIDLDLKAERGLSVARQLVDQADVLVENFSSGVMDRLGLGYRDLAKTNPRLVFASMSAYGHTGPHKGWTGMNVTLQACSGLMLATGTEGGPPIGISNSWNDYIGGLHAAVAIIGALSQRHATGQGRHLDVSQFECSVGMIGSLLLASAVSATPPARLGSRSDAVAPQGVYRCAGDDQWCAISVQNDAQWRALVDVVAADALRDPRYATVAGRHAHHDAIDGALEQWTSRHAPAAIEQQLQQRGVPIAAMLRGNEVVDVAAWRQVLMTLAGAPATEAQVVGMPFVFRGSAPVEATTAPRVGQHDREVLRDWLSLDDAAITDLTREVPA